MTTHRGLTKLERRAHMNIHFTKEIREPNKQVGYTRDRFGKKQRVEGIPRRKRIA